MNITYHAGQRFLERVVNKVDFTKYEVHRTVEYLERVFKDVLPTSYNRYLPLLSSAKVKYTSSAK